VEGSRELTEEARTSLFRASFCVGSLIDLLGGSSDAAGGSHLADRRDEGGHVPAKLHCNIAICSPHSARDRIGPRF